MNPHLRYALVLIALILPGPLAAGTIYVDDDNTAGPWDGSAANPFQYIQDGTDAAVSGVDTVLVRDGLYVGVKNKDLDYGGKAITVRSENGAVVTTIDCEGSGRGFVFQSFETAAAVVDGFTIRNGYVTGDGGGIACWQSSPTITNCTISDCSVLGDGGGIECWISSAVIAECTISGNTANHYAGAIYCDFSDATIVNCTLSGNSALWDAGAVMCVGSSPEIANCLFAGNTAVEYAGAIECFYYSDPTIGNCTFSNNTTGVAGGGIDCTRHSAPTVTNSILWGNSAPAGHEIALRWPSGVAPAPTLTVRHCDVQGGVGEAHVDPGCTLDLDGTDMDADPLFVAGPLHAYYLSHVATGQGADSPCVDSGSDTAANLGLDTLTTRTDHVGDTGTVDMGYHSPRCASGLPGDVDGNGVVDGLDLTAVITAWETAPGDALWNPIADLDCNGIVDGLDLTAVISNWTTAAAAAAASEPAPPASLSTKPGRSGAGPGNVRGRSGNAWTR